MSTTSSANGLGIEGLEDTKVEGKQRRDSAALAAILQIQPELFCNLAGRPTIRVTTTTAAPSQKERPLDSAWVRYWMSEYVWKQTGLILLDGEVTRIIRVLGGMALNDQRTDLELRDAIEQDSLVEALIIWMNEHRCFEGSCSKLHDELTKVAKRCGVNMKGKGWPKSPSRLSRRINDLTAVLQRAGVEVDIGRKAGGARYVILRLNDHSGDNADTPAHKVDVDKAHYPNYLRRCDGSDATYRTNLFEQIQYKNEDTSE